MEAPTELTLIPASVLEEAAECLKVLAHPVRLRLVNCLRQKRLAVHELAELSGTSPSQTCEHLRLLKRHGLLASEREGRTVYYTISSPRLPRLLDCITRHCNEE